MRELLLPSLPGGVYIAEHEFRFPGPYYRSSLQLERTSFEGCAAQPCQANAQPPFGVPGRYWVGRR